MFLLGSKCSTSMGNGTTYNFSLTFTPATWKESYSWVLFQAPSVLGGSPRVSMRSQSRGIQISSCPRGSWVFTLKPIWACPTCGHHCLGPVICTTFSGHTVPLKGVPFKEPEHRFGFGLSQLSQVPSREEVRSQPPERQEREEGERTGSGVRLPTFQSRF